jgi:hypothetical protein
MENKSELQSILNENAHHINVSKFKYFLAMEDFDVFQSFMCERNKQINEETMK